MAPVLARLVRMLAGLCLLGAIAIVCYASVWGVLSFTQVRTHGLVAMTSPERVIDAQGEIRQPAAPPIHAVTGSASAGADIREAAAPESSDAAPQRTDADRTLASFIGVVTVAGIGSIFLLPIVLLVAFVTSLVRAPRAASSTMAGIVWSLILVAMVLPWASWWPQLPWAGLFVSYDDLVAGVAAVERAGGPLSAAPLFVHVGMPAIAIGILVGIAWRCGEALHVELLGAESLQFDASIERDAAAVTARGASMATGRVAASFAAATSSASAIGSPLPARPASSVCVEEAPVEPPPRRLI
ncbi:MAG: hypothetical protein U0572_14000 [Phycisphaerales bacterium]